MIEPWDREVDAQLVDEANARSEQAPQSWQSSQSLILEFANAKPVHEMRDGVRWTHYPEKIVDGLTHKPGVRCACGQMFECDSWRAPTNQPCPELWVGMQAYKAHIAKVQAEDALRCSDASQRQGYTRAEAAGEPNRPVGRPPSAERKS